MTTIQFSSSSEVSEEEVVAALQSRGFLHMILYEKLGAGFKLMQEQDDLREAVIADLTEQHPRIDSDGITAEFLEIFSKEVLKWNEPMLEEGHGDIRLTITASVEQESESPTDAETTVQNYLESRLTEVSPVELKAKEVADETGLQSTHVGAIFGRWRKSSDAPVSVTASETPGGSNIWKIDHAQSESSEDSEVPT